MCVAHVRNSERTSTFADYPLQPLPAGKPWGKKTAYDTDYYNDSPTTGKWQLLKGSQISLTDFSPLPGVVRRYHFTVARAKLAPDGYLRSVLVINGQYPGVRLNAQIPSNLSNLRVWLTPFLANHSVQLGGHDRGHCP